MTVPVQTPRNQVLISSMQTVLPWTWNLQAENELVVEVQRVLDGSIDLLVLDTDYTVDSGGLDNNSGGNITLIGSEDPSTNGDIFTMTRDSILDRSPDFATSGAFLADTINAQLDELTRIDQDQQLTTDATVQKNPGVGDTLNPLIPQMVDRRCAVFEETTPGNFDIVMSATDPDGDTGVITTKGDLLTHTATTAVRLPVGTNGLVVVANSANASGLEWAQVDTAGIADGAVETAKIDAGAVDGTKLADTSVSTNKLQDDAVTSAKLAADTAVTVASDDKVVIKDTSDSDNLKTVTASQFFGGGGGITLGTPQTTTSGTAKDFTAIPAGTKEIVVMFDGVGLSGTNDLLVQLGDVSSFEILGYASSSAEINAANSAITSDSAGFVINFVAGSVATGRMVLSLMDSSINKWVSSHSSSDGVQGVQTGGGVKSLTGELTRVRVTRDGADTFDAGSVNIQYQG